jgi:hypothetical protein
MNIIKKITEAIKATIKIDIRKTKTPKKSCGQKCNQCDNLNC